MLSILCVVYLCQNLIHLSPFFLQASYASIIGNREKGEAMTDLTGGWPWISISMDKNSGIIDGITRMTYSNLDDL